MCSITPYLEKYLNINPESQDALKKWEIQTSELGGRGIFAKQCIAKGELIFINKPVLMGPRPDQVNNGLFCSNCYLISADCYPCSDCDMMLCSQKCAYHPSHIELCYFISKKIKRITGRITDVSILSRAIIYIRALLLSKEDLNFLSLLEKCQKTSTTDEIEAINSEYDVTIEQMQFMNEVSDILKINSFRIAHNVNNKRIPCRGVYPVSSFLNHSCLPNTRNVFGKDHSMAVYASRRIEAGEEILSCYTGLLWCTAARRCQLYNTKGFWCYCLRCRDPTEMGTNLAALKCLKRDCKSVLLPITPLSANSDWRCEQCDIKLPADRVRAIQSVLGSLLRTIDINNQKQLETFIALRIAAAVPTTNHIFVDLSLRLNLKLGLFESNKLAGIYKSSARSITLIIPNAITL